MPNTLAYIDGFNLYHGAVKGTRYKWLNLALLCAAIFPGININLIRYFTATVKPYPHDPKAPFRQHIYLMALETVPNIDIRKSYFERRRRIYPQCPFAYIDPTKPPLKVQVSKSEEKGTDVNIATYLLVDCVDKLYEEAIVISNDADLILPIEMVTRKFGKKVHVVNPHRSRTPNRKLISVATTYQSPITDSMLASCQFAPTLVNANGTQITKPASW